MRPHLWHRVAEGRRVSVMERTTIVNGSLTITSANTEYTLAIPKDATMLKMRLADAAVAWRYSATTGQVAGGAGFPVLAGEKAEVDVRFHEQDLYVAAASAAQTLRYTYALLTRS